MNSIKRIIGIQCNEYQEHNDEQKTPDTRVSTV